jgi:hypothetical protein
MTQFTTAASALFGLRDGAFNRVLRGSKKVLTAILKIYIFQVYYER